jgi:hypothetical protein
MFNWIRQKFGPVVVTLIIGGIAMVFILSDFLAPRGTNGMPGPGAVEAGTVNGEPISSAEFLRELARRTESLKQMTGGKLTDEQLKMFRVRESVFNELVQRKLVLQDCRKAGLVPSDAEVRAKIQELPYFQKDGKFDIAAYQNVLSSNRLTAGKFEDMIRDDLIMQRWVDVVRSRVRISEDEIQREFRIANEKRNLKYVVLDLEAGKKAVQVPASEIDAFLQDSAKLARVKTRYEQDRATKFKDQKLEAVQREIAKDILASERVDEARKANQKLADQIVPLLGKGSDARVQALVKPYGIEVKTTGLITIDSPVPGVNDAQQLLQDAFAEKSPLIASQGGQAKKYESAAWVVIAVVTDVKKPEISKLAGESAKLEQQLRARKERELEEEWIQELRGKAKIKVNSSVINGPETDVS